MRRTKSPFFIMSVPLFLLILTLFSGYESFGQSPTQVLSKSSHVTPPKDQENVGEKSTSTPEKPKIRKDGEKSRDLMEEALELIDEAGDYWKSGDVESALDMLDEAYSLLIHSDEEPDVLRQKDDVRLLIAQRIVAIYTSMKTSTHGKRSEIPLIMNEDVEKEIRSFQTVERDFFIQSYRRSLRFRPAILKELKKAGLPEELSWLPLVESGFKIHALSRARALGLWQFIPSTGYKYGLNRDEWIDERLDVEKSTRAAIDYLKELHGMFGDWLTVLAAYNCGEGRVLKVISRQHINYFDRFWDLYHNLPYETARYVPRFLATLHIIRNQKKYGINLDEIDGSEIKAVDFVYDTVKTYQSMSLDDIAKHIGVEEETLHILNAELRQKITPDKEYSLRIPPGFALKFASVVDDIPKIEKPKKVYVRHRVRRGETVASIARKYRTSVGEVVELNQISSKKKLKKGQIIVVPVQGNVYSNLRYIKAVSRDTVSPVARKAAVTHKVKKGDTLHSIAKRYGTTVNDIKVINKLGDREIRVGEILKVKSTRGSADKAMIQTSGSMSAGESMRASTGAHSRKYVVQKGDTLTKIAKKNGVKVDGLLEANKISRDEILQPGQVIIVK